MRARAVWGAIALVAVFDLLLFIAVSERIAHNGHILPGVRVEGIHAAGATEANARAQLDHLAHTMQQRVIDAKAGPDELHAAAGDLGVHVDVDSTLAAARHDGHSGNPFNAAFGVVLRRMRTDDIPLHVDVSDKAVAAAVAQWDRETVVGVRNAGITIHGTTVAVTPDHGGKGIDTARATTMLRSAAVSPGEDPIVVPLVARRPDVTSAQAQTVAARARKIISSTYTVHSDNHTFAITGAEVASALSAPVQRGHLALTIDATRLRDAVAAPIRALGTPPVNASFTVDSQGHVDVVPSHDGTGPDFDVIGRDILAGRRDFDVQFGATQPDHDTAWAKALGITGLVSSFTTHHPCCEARITNIHRAADIINNTIIEPGQLFSLNSAIGPRTQARGFVQAPVIEDNEFGTDFGGGVSQLSTTTFNAAWWGGYEIVRHTPHSLYISRYPMGREATLNFPQIDMQFRNDTKHGIWLRTSYDGTSVTVALYGNNDGRVVRETYGT
ncbi:MAG TPA: VanW family protein, partial [Acidimicrobiia bacterium]